MNQLADSTILDKKEQILEEIEENIPKEFPRTFWPYNSQEIKSKKDKLIEKSLTELDKYLKTQYADN